jgi:tetratricopeptide (TPR) repeat protein
MNGLLTEGCERLRHALRAAPDNAAAAKATFWAGRLAFLQGEREDAERLFLEALRRARTTSATRVEVRALSHLGLIALSRGDVARSIGLHEQALVIARRGKDDWTLMAALANLGAALNGTGQAERGSPLLEEALELGRHLGDRQVTAVTACNLSELALVRGEHTSADSLVQEALENARSIVFGSVICWALCLRAVLALDRGELHTAASRIREGIQSMRAPAGIIALASAAAIAAARNEPLVAAQIWAALDHEMRIHAYPHHFLATRLREDWLPKARGAVDSIAWEAAWAAGSALLPEDALNLAMTA